jgi:hypothetical protein
VAREPRVISPIRKLYSRNDVDVALVSIEVWPTGLVVRLAGVPTEATRVADEAFHSALEAWARRGATNAPPAQPASEVFDIALEVSDDLGTRYTLITGSSGGSGSMFRADWFFEPGVPVEATRLTVRVGTGSEHLAAIDIDV